MELIIIILTELLNQANEMICVNGLTLIFTMCSVSAIFNKVTNDFKSLNLVYFLSTYLIFDILLH